jgi:CubicO group peptidase (beta-lactamase class C family)
MVERITNQPLNEFLKQNIYDPLGLTTMSYLPADHFPTDSIAPSAIDKDFRKNVLLQGYVQDQQAALFGGVAGHAGLFSDAHDLAVLMQMELQKGYYGGFRYFSPETIDEFTSRQYRLNRRGLGWDKPNSSDESLSPASGYVSSSSFGHTGFTGTMVWDDPGKNLVYVFLSNRTYPDMENQKLSELDVRKRIQTVIYSALLNK